MDCANVVAGNLTQAELSWVLQPLLSAAPSVVTSANANLSPTSTLVLHNQLITCLYANIQRDAPPSEVAPWVVATDKPTAASKAGGAAGANDKAEERLKREVMGLHARDRRRIKSLKPDATARAADAPVNEMLKYQQELELRGPEVPTQATGGLAKTNWDIEIRRKYALPLAQESLEFPSQSDVQNRIEPICYEEGLVGGAPQGSLQAISELVEQAAEVYIKELLSQLCMHSRSNGEGCIQTSKFRRQLQREEDDVERGILQRSAAGLLPVEIDLSAKREPLNVEDMRLALTTGDRYFRSEPFLAESIVLDQFSAFGQGGDLAVKPIANGTVNGDTMDIDEADLGWHGGTHKDMDSLMGVLDDCLAVA